MTQLLVIVGYLLSLLLLGGLANRLFRGTAKDYMLASHTIGPFLLLMSLFGTTMTAFALIGSTGRAYTLGVGVYGLLASASGILHSLCFLWIGVPLWTFGRRLGHATQIQFFRERLESPAIGWLLFPILVLLVVGYLLVGVVGGGEVVQVVTASAFQDLGWFEAYGYGVPRWLASAVICLVVLTYVFFGGMRGTAWANAFQTAVFLVLGMVTFVTIANALGGGSSLFENLQKATQSVPEANLGRVKIPKPIFFSFLWIPVSVGMFPHVFQHWLTARDANAFKLPIVVHPLLVAAIWFPCVLLGIWASGDLAAIPDGTPENLILGTLVQQHAGPALGGLLTAGILAAIMSSLDSQFLCLGTMFTEDVLKRLRGPDAVSDRQSVIAARAFVIGIVLLTYLLSLVLPRAVFDLGLWSFSGFTGLVPLAVAAIYWRRLTAAGALAGGSAMLLTWVVLFYRSEFGSNARYGFPEAPWEIGGGLAIPPMLPVVTITLVTAVVMVAVSLVTRPPSAATLGKFFPDRSDS